MNKTTMYGIVAVVVIVVVVAAVAGAYVLMNPGGGGGDGNGNGGGEDVITAANATSLQYDALVTSQGTTITYKFAGKDLGTSNLTFRIDLLGGEAGNYIYILNGAQKEAWANADGTWTDVSSDFTNQWAAWEPQWTANVNALVSWSGTGEYTYTAANGDSIVISNISLNPTLADSLFQPS